jgi:hypothetical protein
MKKAILFSILACLVIALPAKVSLMVTLDKVAKDPAAKVAKVGEDGAFSDSMISIVWEARADGFEFELTNKTGSKLSIPWKECRFINEENETFTVVHGEAGAVFEIEAKGTGNSVVAPADYFSWPKKGWEIEPIFQARMSDEEFEAVKDKDILYKVVLPILKDKVKTVYTFTFKTIAE